MYPACAAAALSAVSSFDFGSPPFFSLAPLGAGRRDFVGVSMLHTPPFSRVREAGSIYADFIRFHPLLPALASHLSKAGTHFLHWPFSNFWSEGEWENDVCITSAVIYCLALKLREEIKHDQLVRCRPAGCLSAMPGSIIGNFDTVVGSFAASSVHSSRMTHTSYN